MKNTFEETTEIIEINEAYTSKCDALGDNTFIHIIKLIN